MKFWIFEVKLMWKKEIYIRIWEYKLNYKYTVVFVEIPPWTIIFTKFMVKFQLKNFEKISHFLLNI